MSRAHNCDGCGDVRLTWKRLCDSCFKALPGPIRSRLINAHRRGDMRTWRHACTAARAHLRTPAAPAPSTSPQTAYALTQAITGDRD